MREGMYVFIFLLNIFILSYNSETIFSKGLWYFPAIGLEFNETNSSFKTLGYHLIKIVVMSKEIP